MSSAVSNGENNVNEWKGIYKLGAASTALVLAGIMLDGVIGITTGGNLTAIPKTAVERFAQLLSNPLLGLYNLDLLNTIIQLILIPSYFALYAVHRKCSPGFSALAFIIFLIGTILFVAGNTALPMLELSKKYFNAETEMQKQLIAAAGEAMLAKGSHGSAGVFLAFLLPNIAGVVISSVMLKGKIFGRSTSILGLAGSMLMLCYVVLVTFVPGVETMATAFAAPGGLLLMAWMALFMVKLYRLGN